MSETEHIKGTIKKLKMTEGLSFSDGIKKIKDYHGIHIECDIEDEWLNPDSGFCYSNGFFFEIVSKDNIDPYNDIQRIRRSSIDEFEFEFKFYNGGTCFSEMLDESLKKLIIKRNKT